MSPHNVAMRVLASELDHPEGLCWHPDGFILAGGEAGQIYRVQLDGTVKQIGDTGGSVLGLATDGADQLLVCNLGRQALLRMSLSSGQVDVLSLGTETVPLRTPNTVTFGPDGTLYFTDSGTWDGDDGCVFAMDPEGRTRVWSTRVSSFPNGSAFDEAGNRLLVVESTGPGVTAIPVLADGSAGEPYVVVKLPGIVPDGVALDRDGGILIACYRPDAIYRYTTGDRRLEILAADPRGTLLAAPTNVAFIGDELNMLATANLGRWHLTVLNPPVPGARMCHPTRVGIK